MAVGLLNLEDVEICTAETKNMHTLRTTR
jgi:hypothetical protein